MTTRAQITMELLKLGYKGSVNLSKPDLERKLSSMRAVQDDDFDKGVVVSDFYGSVHKGFECKIEGENRAKYTFVKHVKSETQEYVEVQGGKRGHAQTRCFVPSKLRTKGGQLP